MAFKALRPDLAITPERENYEENRKEREKNESPGDYAYKYDNAKIAGYYPDGTAAVHLEDGDHPAYNAPQKGEVLADDPDAQFTKINGAWYVIDPDNPEKCWYTSKEPSTYVTATNPITKSINSFKEIATDLNDGLKSRGSIVVEDPSLYNVTNSMSLGILDSINTGAKNRADKMSESKYDFANWATSGIVGMVDGAINPTDPLSKEHWESSFGTALLITGVKPNVTTSIDDATTTFTKGPSASTGTGEMATLGKDELIVADKSFLNEQGRIDWDKYAPNGGYVEGTRVNGVTLEGGTVIDRYGSPKGNYTSPVGASYESRALPYTENANAYHQYRIIKPIENVSMGEIAPAFKQPGGGIQYELPNSIEYLIEKKYLEVIN